MATMDELRRKIARTEVDCPPTQHQRFGERYEKYRQEYSVAGALEFEPSFPLYIMFEQTYRCNLKCPSCLRGHPELMGRYKHDVPVMPRDLFEQVITEGVAKGLPSVAMHNIDEPLLVKDIAERIRFACEQGVMDIFMTTNGQLLSKDKAEEVCAAGLTHILFSIDAASEEVYSLVRPGSVLSQVEKAIGRIRNWRARMATDLPIIRASFVLSKHNQSEEAAFLEKFGELADYIDVQNFYSVGDVTRDLAPKGHRPVNPDRFLCSEPYRKVIVRANGDVLPCCSVYGYQLVMGNAYKNSIAEIFNGPAMRALRKELREHRYNAVCAECVGTVYETV